jgi:hypothetical protein
MAAYDVEKSIYLAGSMKEKSLLRPYSTQIRLIPADACLRRYRQITQIEEWLQSESDKVIESRHYIATLINEMGNSYLIQALGFSADAYIEDPTHVQAIYMCMMTKLLQAERLAKKGFKPDSVMLEGCARRLIIEIPIPKADDHYKQIEYHQLNYSEFKSNPTLSKQYPDICERLKELSDAAVLVAPGHKPPEYFDTSFWISGGKSGVAGVMILASLAAGMSTESAKPILDLMWDSTIEYLVESLDESVSDQRNETGSIISDQTLDAHTSSISVALHDGGVASQELHSQLASHDGGVASQELHSQLASHDGGVATSDSRTNLNSGPGSSILYLDGSVVLQETLGGSHEKSLPLDNLRLWLG